MNDRPRPNYRITRRGFLKLSSALGAAAVGQDVLAALGKGPGTQVAYAQGEGAPAPASSETTETQLEYWKRLTEQIQVGTGNVEGKDSITLGLKPEGKQTLTKMDINDPKNLTTTDFALIAALKEASASGSLPDDPAAYTDYLTGNYDIQMLSDDLVQRYLTEPQAAGVVNSYLAPRADGAFALNLKGVNVLSTLADGSFKFAIPQETLNAAKDAKAEAPAENVPADQHPAAASVQEGVAPVPDTTPPPVKLEATPAPLTPEQKKAKEMIPWLLGLGATGLSLLGLGWLVSRRSTETSGPGWGKTKNREKQPVSVKDLAAAFDRLKDQK